MKKDKGEKYNNFNMTLEECRLVLDKLQNLVVVDRNGYIKYLSPDMFFMIEASNKKAVPKNVAGKHITEIHPLSKITNALKTGESEKTHIYLNSDVVNIARIEPLYDDKELVGAIDYDIFTDGQELREFLDVIADYASKGLLNYSDTFHSMYEKSTKSKKIKYTINDFIGVSQAAKELRLQIANLSESNSTVIISGKTGCGKELVAHSIHNTSKRCMHPIVEVNCAAIPETLVESELFGYEEGTFTGAKHGGRIGLFEKADKGTLFLDEVDQLPYHIQPKLLRALQEREITTIGGKTKPVDVRVISATNKDLWQMVKEGKFREDLYYRLNVVEVIIPPLSERKEDIPLLAHYQLKKLNEQMGKSVEYISEEVLKLFMEYAWPGNVRELNNLLERSLLLCHGDTLKLEHMGGFFSKVLDEQPDLDFSPIAPLEEIKLQAEKRAIEKTLELTNGNRTKAANVLKISRTALYDKLKRYNLL